MQPEQIQSWEKWSSDNQQGLDNIIIASRQISHLAGVNLKMKGRWKGNSSFGTLKFSISPKLLKWKGISGWERVVMVIRSIHDKCEFCIMIDGKPMLTGPERYWNPIKSASHVMERVTKKIHKPKDDSTKFA